jgi:hypothetical protein
VVGPRGLEPPTGPLYPDVSARISVCLTSSSNCRLAFPRAPRGGHHVASGPTAADFKTADGRWLRVQGAFPTERKRLAKALGTSVDLSEVAAAVRKYPGEETWGALLQNIELMPQ